MCGVIYIPKYQILLWDASLKCSEVEEKTAFIPNILYIFAQRAFIYFVRLLNLESPNNHFCHIGQIPKSFSHLAPLRKFLNQPCDMSNFMN